MKIPSIAITYHSEHGHINTQINFMKTKIFQTSSSWSPTVIRILLGSVLLAHGCQKALGWFGGYGFEGTMGFFTGTMGLPWLVAFLVILIEFIGSLSLILGFATRLWVYPCSFCFWVSSLRHTSKTGFS
jgi:uncharacterized membrane protein YphA (DoxX/SURF4 family)